MTFFQRNMQWLSKSAQKLLLPVLLCFEVMRIILRTYVSNNYNAYCIIFLVMEIVLFAVFEYIKPKKIIRAVVYIAMAVVVLAFGMTLMRLGWSRSNVLFINWFYVVSSEVGQVMEYVYFVLFCLGFFIISIGYYFTVIRFRAFGTMLMILFPFVIYGKRADSISTIDTVIMLTLFLAIMVHSKLTADDMTHDTVMNVSYVVGTGLFVTFVGAAAMFMPKPELKSYLEENSNFFDFSINSNSGAYNNLNDVSSARFGANATGELIFTMNSSSDEQVIYLRRQSFDTFNKNAWRYSDSFEAKNYTNLRQDKSDNVVGSTKYFYNEIRNASLSGELESVGISKTKYAENLFADKATIHQQYESSYSPTYTPATLNIAADEDISDSYYNVKFLHSETFPYPYHIKSGEQMNYTSMDYYYYPETQKLADFAASLDFDTAEFVDMLDKTNSQYISDEDIENYKKLVSLYGTTNDDEVSDRLTELAVSLTSDSRNDYEKAEKLVDYFATNGFTYDLEYEPDDESIDYFVFDSKTGSCTSYATAMTLMARSVGLPARYVEGFAAYEKSEDNKDVFAVRDSNAHAFVECYIAGIGWMTFDPTIPEYMVTHNSGGNTSQIISAIFTYLGRAALFIGAAFVVLFIILIDTITERIFRIRLSFKSNTEKVLMLYRRVVKLLMLSSDDKLEGYTADEVASYLLEKRYVDLRELTKLFEKVCFGDSQPSDDEWKKVYAEYKKSWKQLAKGIKSERKKAAL